MFYICAMKDRSRPPNIYMEVDPPPNSWPKPPSALPAERLDEPSVGALVCVAGLVLVRQRPGTAKGVVFLTLEDETGTANVVVWKSVYEKFRRAVVSARLLRVTGRLQRDHLRRRRRAREGGEAQLSPADREDMRRNRPGLAPQGALNPRR